MFNLAPANALSVQQILVAPRMATGFSLAVLCRSTTAATAAQTILRLRGGTGSVLSNLVIYRTGGKIAQEARRVTADTASTLVSATDLPSEDCIIFASVDFATRQQTLHLAGMAGTPAQIASKADAVTEGTINFTAAGRNSLELGSGFCGEVGEFMRLTAPLTPGLMTEIAGIMRACYYGRPT